MATKSEATPKRVSKAAASKTLINMTREASAACKKTAADSKTPELERAKLSGMAEAYDKVLLYVVETFLLD